MTTLLKAETVALVRDTLGAQSADYLYQPELDVHRIHLYVPDMVPPLRKWTISFNGEVQASTNRAYLSPFRRVIDRIERERDARRWSACDQ